MVEYQRLLGGLGPLRFGQPPRCNVAAAGVDQRGARVAADEGGAALAYVEEPDLHGLGSGRVWRAIGARVRPRATEGRRVGDLIAE